MQTIKRITLDDYNHLGIVYSDEFVKERGLKIGDKVDDSDDFLIDGGKGQEPNEENGFVSDDLQRKS